MTKPVCTAILAALLSIPTMAMADELADKYFSAGSKPEVMSPQERAALRAARNWGKGHTVRPFTGENGVIMFVYGTDTPRIVCAVLQVCDLALQTGEKVNNIHLGDKARWAIEPGITGTGDNQTQHLIIKPLDVGLQTSLIVNTNRRAYHIQLRSHRSNYMPQVAFSYPEDDAAKWAELRQQEQRKRETDTIPQTGEYLGDLSFDYRIEGSAPWKPVRVYHDNSKTIIELPRTMAQTEAPTLLLVRQDGGWFSDEETVMINYRIQGNRYIVDTVIDKAILFAGVGKSQQRITITREKGRDAS
ncbi:P-type conjugative transfer protein TrbG [Lautropia mirabilis]